jgi:hypothetical protein
VPIWQSPRGVYKCCKWRAIPHSHPLPLGEGRGEGFAGTWERSQPGPNLVPECGRIRRGCGCMSGPGCLGARPLNLRWKAARANKRSPRKTDFPAGYNVGPNRSPGAPVAAFFIMPPSSPNRLYDVYLLDSRTEAFSKINVVLPAP